MILFEIISALWKKPFSPFSLIVLQAIELSPLLHLFQSRSKEPNEIGQFHIGEKDELE
jgi:hypothetical protein